MGMESSRWLHPRNKTTTTEDSMEEIREATDLGSRQEIVLIVLDMLVSLAPGLVSDKVILFDEVELISIFSQQFYQKFFHLIVQAPKHFEGSKTVEITIDREYLDEWYIEEDFKPVQIDRLEWSG